MESVRFEARQIPVLSTHDVVVAGGGTAGAVAGISAARQGASTLILERYGALGGSQTMGLVTPVMHCGIPGNPQSSALADEIHARLAAAGHALDDEGRDGTGWFDPLGLEYVLERLVVESGCGLLYGATVIGVILEGERITHLVFHDDDGLRAVAAAQFIDATGDGELSVMAGAAYEGGNDEGWHQAVSLRFQMTHVDLAAFREHLRSLGETHPEGERTLHTASVSGNDRWRLAPLFARGREEGLLTEQDTRYFQCFSVPGKPRDLCFNCPELGATRGDLGAAYRTDRLIAGRSAICRLAAFLKQQVRGFEQAYVSRVAPMLGVRESRRIVCEYTLTGKDIARNARFEDFIATSNYPIDIHSAGEDQGLQFTPAEPGERYYQLPLRSLVARGKRNLFVVGRCLGADFVAQSSVRVQHTCRASGEAAGIAAALAASRGVGAAEVPGAEVRAVMAARGARFV